MASRSASAVLALRYVETSALLAALLEGHGAARRALRVPGTLVTSALTLAEARRGVIRARRAQRLTAEQERSALSALARFRRRCAVMPVTDDPQWLTILTLDQRIVANARAIGYELAL